MKQVFSSKDINEGMLHLLKMLLIIHKLKLFIISGPGARRNKVDITYLCVREGPPEVEYINGLNTRS